MPTEASPGEKSDRWIEGLNYEDDEMSPIDLEIRVPRTGRISQLKVIGVLDRAHHDSWDMISSNRVLNDLVPFDTPITTYRFRVADGLDTKRTARRLEAAFLEHGMETEDLEARISQIRLN